MWQALVLSLAGLAACLPQPSQNFKNVSSAILHQNSSASAAAASSSWWYANIDHTTGAVRDYAPGIGDDNYPVFMSVSTSAELYNAILSNGPNGGQRPSYSGSDAGQIIGNSYLSAEPRVIYIQPGTYTLDRTLRLTGDTILIGDAKNPPTLKASSGFSDQWVVLGGQDLKYYYSDGQPHNQGGELRFSVMMKNLIIDTTAASGNSNLYALSWRVAQNAGLVNIQINMPQGAHTGLYLGQGSTIQVADVSFTYGNRGIEYDGMQQASLKNMKFKYCTTGIYISGGFAVNIMAPTFDTVGQAIQSDAESTWLSVVDATSINSGTFLSVPAYPNLMLENINRDNDRAVLIVGSTTKIGNVRNVGHYVYGNTHGANPVYQTNNPVQGDKRPSSLLVGGKYPNITPNQYLDKTANDVINLKDKSQNGGNSLYGDGYTIDGPALQTGLNTAAKAGKIAYLPFGVYRVDNTITIPPGTVLIGNGWSIISGVGKNFQDQNNPRPVVQVGVPGSTGTADIQDIHITAGEQIPGGILMQVNMAGNPGDVTIHNSLITVGGTKDTSINCGGSNNCAAAYIGLHLSSTSSAYVNNLWAWVADHSVDGENKGTNAAAKGGVLVEATKGTWLFGLGSEHFWYYNLAYNKASNVAVSLFQSETNYREGQGGASDLAPAPFTPTSADPDFSWCNGSADVCRMTINQWFNGGSNIVSYGSGSWNFGQNGQTNAQANVNVISSMPSGLQMYGLCAGPNTHYIMRLPDGTRFGDGGNDGYKGSWGTLVAALTS